MYYKLTVSVERGDTLTVDVSGLSFIPLINDTVAVESGDKTNYGVVKHRHFNFLSPVVCHVSLVCSPDNG